MNLFNKYRPKTWAEIKGQDKTVKMLQDQIKQNKIANAYLFSGSSGVGKTTVARLLFYSLNCENKKGNNPCYECSNCKNYQYNLIEIDGATNRGIDEARELQKEINLNSFSGGYRGILVDEAHQLTKPAWDALLKTIEETPKKSVWLFCTTELSKIPKTIKSRCQSFNLSLLKFTDIKNRLQEICLLEKKDITEEILWDISKNAEHNLRTAVSLLEQYIISNIYNLQSKELYFLDVLQKNNKRDLWKFFDSWEDNFNSFEHFLNSCKLDLITLLKIKLELVTELTPYLLKKYEQYKTIDTNKLKEVLSVLIKLQQQTSGVYDYSTLLFLSYLQIIK